MITKSCLKLAGLDQGPRPGTWARDPGPGTPARDPGQGPGPGTLARVERSGEEGIKETADRSNITELKLRISPHQGLILGFLNPKQIHMKCLAFSGGVRWPGDVTNGI